MTVLVEITRDHGEVLGKLPSIPLPKRDHVRGPRWGVVKTVSIFHFNFYKSLICPKGKKDPPKQRILPIRLIRNKIGSKTLRKQGKKLGGKIHKHMRDNDCKRVIQQFSTYLMDSYDHCKRVFGNLEIILMAAIKITLTEVDYIFIGSRITWFFFKYIKQLKQ